MCEKAVSLGLTHLAITDHYDINAVEEGIYPRPDLEGIAECIERARKKYSSRLIISRGIELGSALQYPERAREILKEGDFDTVVASVHYMRDHNDFYYWDMTDQTKESFERAFLLYLDDIEETLDMGHVQVLAHLTYPLRYFLAGGKLFPIFFAEKKIESILSKVIKKGVLLEVNSSGFRQGLDAPLPDRYILEMYRELGGRLISAGSDAHSPSQIGQSYGLCADYLKSCGFTKAHFIMKNEIYQCEI